MSSGLWKPEILNFREKIAVRAVGSTVSDEEMQDDSVEKQRIECENGNPNFAAEAPVGAGDHENGNGARTEVLEQRQPSLLDVVKMMSKKPDGRFRETDILEIAAMKGIDFPLPRWWIPGEYEVQKPKGMR